MNKFHDYKNMAIAILVVLVLTLFASYNYRDKNVCITIDQKEMDINTKAKTVGELLEENNISLKDDDYINVDSAQRIKNDLEIEIKRNKPVVLNLNGYQVSIDTHASTVNELLEELNIEKDGDDIVKPHISAKITPKMDVEVTHIDKVLVEKSVNIPYSKVYKKAKDLEIGKTRVFKEGKEGMKKLFVEQTFKGNELISENVVKEETITEPIPEVVEEGTKNILVASRGNTRYKKAIIMNASAYDLSYKSTGKKPGDSNYGLTASGTKARPGVVAVDTDVIPLGTKLYIESTDRSKDYGFAVAEDTGSAIKGKRIDLFFESHSKALAFGRRKVKVYILE